jgi:hypothetical protein
MRKRIVVTILISLLSCGLVVAAMGAAPVGGVLTLRSLGAVGDGRTDDRAAITEALNRAQGAPVDGEGLTYAVHGNIEVTGNIDLRNAKLVQTMGPPDTRRFLQRPSGGGAFNVVPAAALRSTVKGLPLLRPDGEGTYADAVHPSAADLAALTPGINLRTLAIRGAEGKPVAVRLEKVAIDRGRYPDSGGRTEGAGIQLEHAGPVLLREVTVAGDGKGTGIMVSRCAGVRIERAYIHDMNWAPYAGDEVLDQLTADEIRDDFHWNNFPIYEFRGAKKRFVRVRIQEQLVGIFVGLSTDVEIHDTRIERLQVKIGGQYFPLQSDAITIGQTKGLVIRNTHMAKVWEGIDFTGRSGQDFLFANCSVTDTIGWAFKLAHPKQNGRIVDCTAVRGGIAGFLVGAETENVELARCQALETGGNGYWDGAGGKRLMVTSGFRIQGVVGQKAPSGIRLVDCTAINVVHPGGIDHGVYCEDATAGHDITLHGFATTGAKLQDLKGIVDAAAGAVP